MGVVNCTPDSFYAASRRLDAKEAVAQALRCVEEGANWIDIGGQSTRPGSDPVSVSEELRRVVPVVEELSRKTSLPISIDTDKPEVARRAREAGATILNDIRALRVPGMMDEAVRFKAVILMHMGGDSPKTMQRQPRYGDVVGEVAEFLKERMSAFLSSGGEAARVLIDPGIGFGKTLEHNLSLLKQLSRLVELAPVVVGVSRKSFLSRITPDAGPEERLEGSLAAALWAAAAGAKAVRVHDVAATRRALDAAAAISGAA